MSSAHRSGSPRRLSPPLVAATVLLPVGGAIVGLVTPPPTRVVPEHNPVLNAWPAHLMVTVVVVVVLAACAVWQRRRGGVVDLLVPWRRSTARRLVDTVRGIGGGGTTSPLAAALRTVVMVLALLVIAFTLSAKPVTGNRERGR